jgi:hypothetical protein
MLPTTVSGDAAAGYEAGSGEAGVGDASVAGEALGDWIHRKTPVWQGAPHPSVHCHSTILSCLSRIPPQDIECAKYGSSTNFTVEHTR